jgi:hypothetical protein
MAIEKIMPNISDDFLAVQLLYRLAINRIFSFFVFASKALQSGINNLDCRAS